MNAEEEKARLFEIIFKHMRINGGEYCSTSEFEYDIEDAAEEIYKDISTLRAQLAEARELISDAKIEIGFSIYGKSQPSNSTYDKLTAYLQKVKSA